MGKFLKECFLQKTNQYDALKVWKKLDVGVSLSLRRDKKDNIVARLEDSDEITIGILSQEDAQSMEPYFAAGWNSSSTPENILYSSIISRFDAKADENKRISIAIFIENYNLSGSKSNANKVK